MPDDLRSLLAAVVADPADDTVRLAYADCLEEHGNSARAEFIRVQIEAERHHPDSAKRAALDEQAASLFAEHWIDWWGEVCEAVGLPMPAPKAPSRLGRLARRIRLGARPGDPYGATGMVVGPRSEWLVSTFGVSSWCLATFRRGFPDSLLVRLRDESEDPSSVFRWPAGSPLLTLEGYFATTRTWVDGPHLAGVRTLILVDYEPALLQVVAGSPHLARLEDLSLITSEFADGAGVVEVFADRVAEDVVSLRGRRLKRLALQVWTDTAAEAVAGAAHLASLTALEVDILPDSSADLAGAARRLATLARSPHLAGLRELKVVGPLNTAGLDAVLRNPTWTGLRKLELDARFWYENLDPLAGPSDLDELEELRLTGQRLPAGLVRRLGRSPLVKRLRHFALRGQYHGGHPLLMFDMVDADRIETFALQVPGLPEQQVEALRARFGDRFRFLV